MGSNTVTAGAIYCDMTVVKTVGDSVAMQVQTTPGTPFTITARIASGLPATGQKSITGLVLRNSTSGRLYTVGSYLSNSGAYALVSTWGGPTSINSNPFNNPYGLIQYFRLVVTATTVSAYVSVDGSAWQLLDTTTIASYLTATGGSMDQVGWFADDTLATDGHALLYWFRRTA